MGKKLRALLVDDEERARRLLKKLLEETLRFGEIRMAHDVPSANLELAEFNPDLVFLDIKMPGSDGFAIVDELLQKKNSPGIVFVTAYEQYALQAIKSHAFDYLLKPVNRKELELCVLKYIEKSKEASVRNNRVSTSETGEKITRIKVSTRTGTAFINPATILYCKADGNYTTICTGGKHHLCSMNIGKLEEQLPRNGFIRVGRSCIVNFEFITMLDRKESQVTLEREGVSVTIKIPRQHLKDLDVI